MEGRKKKMQLFLHMQFNFQKEKQICCLFSYSLIKFCDHKAMQTRSDVRRELNSNRKGCIFI